jgi:hypothetical protein
MEEVKKEEVVTEKENKAPETIPYDRFKTVNDENKNLKEKLKEFETTAEAEKRKAEEDKAKASGDYSKLVEKVSSQEKKMKERVKEMTLTTLGIKNGIAKPEYAKLFEADFKITDELEIENYSDIETAFDKFKTENPTLFAMGKKVPGTDNKPQHKIQIDGRTSMSPIELIMAGLEQRKK